ncbi:MAG: homoserine O-succinyltransferase, partial [Clostridiales bacterium]|nr:homoserine O-succinyltransferase [Clostridiales bacterium]
MPVRISRELPAYAQLTNENIFVMSEQRAVSQ